MKRRRIANPVDPVSLGRLISGDEAAWKRLFDEYHVKLVAWVKRSFDCVWQDAEDAVLDGWNDIWGAIRGRPRKVLYPAFFYICVHRRASRLIKRLKKQPTISLNQPCGEEGTLLDVIVVPDETVSAAMERELWERAWECLDETERFVIHCIYFDGKTVKQVSDELGKTKHQVRYRKEQALEKLQQCLRRSGMEGPG